MSDLFKNLEWNKKIEVLRTIKGWSQEEAAEKCFTNIKSYWEWENGKANPRKISKQAIAKAFGVPENEIFNNEQT